MSTKSLSASAGYIILWYLHLHEKLAFQGLVIIGTKCQMCSVQAISALDKSAIYVHIVLVETWTGRNLDCTSPV
jgi:hypothetical protein